ncbi:MAG: CDP-diacylglycerol--serine O-phosphatidyltransferase [Chitinophagales bacterium]
MKHIPNLFTLLNLFFGCCAIVFLLQNGIIVFYNGDNPELVDMPEKTMIASLFIGLAAVVDFLDGFIARLFKATSKMGKQLDSLADVISFGVAPGIIIYQFLRLSYAKEENGLDVSLAWLMPAFILPCAAAWRLAKFNIDEGQQYSFRGVPTPAVGLVVASFPLIYWYSNNETVIDLLRNKWLLYAVVFLLSYLMVSNWPIMSLKFRDFSLKNNIPKIILLAASILLAILFKWLAVPMIFILYIAVSLAFKNKSA